MKKFTIPALLLCGIAILAMAMSTATENLNWMTNLPQAQAKAKTENKLVMMDFTGSDWCVWCKKLNREVFSTKDFADYAAKNLVLVEVDFPQAKPQSDEQKKANSDLQAKYNVQGYPTVIVLDSTGKKVGEL